VTEKKLVALVRPTKRIDEMSADELDALANKLFEMTAERVQADGGSTATPPG
jgi:hypothetical protein